MKTTFKSVVICFRLLNRAFFCLLFYFRKNVKKSVSTEARPKFPIQKVCIYSVPYWAFTVCNQHGSIITSSKSKFVHFFYSTESHYKCLVRVTTNMENMDNVCDLTKIANILLGENSGKFESF